MDATSSSSDIAIEVEVGEPRSAGRRILVRSSGAHLDIASDISESLSVTDAEIRLMMAALGDTIAQILNPPHSNDQ